MRLVGSYADGSTAPLSGAAGVVYGSSDSNVFTVTVGGRIQPHAVGVANLEVTYEGHSLTEPVSVVGPVAIRPVLEVDPLYLGARNLQITLLADFPDGQTDVNATAHLDAMNRMGGAPWPLTFSYSRALQAVALKGWRGQAGNVAAAQKAFFHRARMNGLAAKGQWKPEMEKEAVAA